jgi:predicted ATPase
MFFTPDQIANSTTVLVDVHPFHGITFMTCKKAELPVGQAVDFLMDARTAEFMRQYHKIDPDSEFFFQPYLKPAWVRPDYPSSGLQAINTQTFAKAFLHERNTRIWGWAADYVSVLEEGLKKRKRRAIRMPAFHLSVWLYKDKEWPDGTSTEDVINFFFEDFHITENEKKALFDTDPPLEFLPANIFQKEKSSWPDWQQFIPQASDSKPDQGGTLTYLETRGVGPADRFILEPAERLTLITGDNGLGKTFLLECAWWALTSFWADRPAYPNRGTQNKKAEITFEIEGERSRAERKTISFDWKTQTWPHPRNRPTIPGLIVYARVDGSFAVWDPAKQAIRLDPSKGNDKSVFTSAEVWDGLQGQIEGLIRDWVTWQNNPQRYPFETFIKVLESLSPPDLGTLKPGQPVRIPDDPRAIPTIVHPYAETPIVYASAGVKRIITLAYLIVWAWNEHLIAADQRRTQPQRRMVILVDEMEAHLHPRWQRAVLPALMSIGDMLYTALETQFLVATHSPLVMASAETVFDADRDSLVHLDLSDRGIVSLQETDFVRWGDVSSWLTSPIFELTHARSREAETAIENAKSLQLRNDVLADEVEEVSGRLIKYLAPDDQFWPRWIAFAEKFGVEL